MLGKPDAGRRSSPPQRRRSPPAYETPSRGGSRDSKRDRSSRQQRLERSVASSQGGRHESPSQELAMSPFLPFGVSTQMLEGCALRFDNSQESRRRGEARGGSGAPNGDQPGTAMSSGNMRRVACTASASVRSTVSAKSQPHCTFDSRRACLFAATKRKQFSPRAQTPLVRCPRRPTRFGILLPEELSASGMSAAMCSDM